MVHLQKFRKDAGVPFITHIERDAFSVKNSLCKDEVLDLGVEPPHIRLHWMLLPPPGFSITRAAIDFSLEETPKFY